MPDTIFRSCYRPLLLYSPELFPQSRPTSPNSKAKRSRPLCSDCGPPLFKTWLEQDVVRIITPEEKAAFKMLQNGEQRDQFVGALWSRRDRHPTPTKTNTRSIIVELSTRMTISVAGTRVGRRIEDGSTFEAAIALNPLSSSGPHMEKSIALFNSRYRLEIAAQYAQTEKSTTWTGTFNVRP